MIYTCPRDPHNATAHHRRPLPANTRPTRTPQPPHMSPSLHNNNLVQSMVTKRYTGGRMHGMFQGLGCFCVCKIAETMATACAAASDQPCSSSPPSSADHWVLPPLLPQSEGGGDHFIDYTHTCKHKYLMPMTPRFIVFTCYIAYAII